MVAQPYTSSWFVSDRKVTACDTDLKYVINIGWGSNIMLTIGTQLAQISVWWDTKHSGLQV